MKWELHGGIWRCHPYKVVPEGRKWKATRQARDAFPYRIEGSPFESEHDAMAACFDDARACADRWNPAGTENREEGMRVEVR